MSAPDTRLEKQKKRHRGPLVGIALALLVAGGLFVAYLGYTAQTDTPTAVDPVPATPLPAEGAPVTPLADPDSAPSVIDETPAPTE